MSTARSNYWTNVNRLKSPEVHAILTDKERLDLASTIKDVSSSNMLNESYMSYKWANLMIELVNKRFAQMQTKHFARYS